jgi:hypothetical protein
MRATIVIGQMRREFCMRQGSKNWKYLLALIVAAGGVSYLVVTAGTRPSEGEAVHPVVGRALLAESIEGQLPSVADSKLSTKDEAGLGSFDRAAEAGFGDQGIQPAEEIEWVLVVQVLPCPMSQDFKASLRVDGVDSDQQPCWFQQEVALNESGSFEIGITQFVGRLHPENARPIRVRLDMGLTLAAKGSFYLSDSMAENRDGVVIQLASVT